MDRKSEYEIIPMKKSIGCLDDTPRKRKVKAEDKENRLQDDDLKEKRSSSRRSLDDLSNNKMKEERDINVKSTTVNSQTGEVSAEEKLEFVVLKRPKPSPLLHKSSERSLVESQYQSIRKSALKNLVEAADEYVSTENSKKITALKLKQSVKKILPGGRKKHENIETNTESDDFWTSYRENRRQEGPTIFHDACYEASSLEKIRKCYYHVSKVDRCKVDKENQSPLDLLFQNEELAKSLQVYRKNESDIVFDEKKLSDVALFALTVYDEMDTEITWTLFKKWIEFVENIEQSRNESESQWFSFMAKLQKQKRRLQRFRGENEQDDQIDVDTEPKDQDDYVKPLTQNVFRYSGDIELPFQVTFALKLLSVMINDLNDWWTLQKSIKSRGSFSPHSLPLDAASLEMKPRKPFLRRKKRSVESERFDGRRSISTIDNEFQKGPRESIKSILISFSSVPYLMKTFLLIDDDIVRSHVFQIQVINKAMLLKQSIQGAWLGKMLQHNHRKRGVEYLFLLSELSTKEARRAEQKEDEEKSQELNELFQTIGELEGFLPSMLGIDNNDIEDLATTPMITNVLDRMITMPFASTLFFFDFVFLAFLIFSFRRCVDTYLQRQDPSTVLTWLYFTLFGAFHFQMRAIGRGASLIAMTRDVSFRNAILFNIWTLVHTGCMVMVISCIITIRYHAPKGVDNYLINESVRSQFAVTTLLLWFNVLGLVKSMNAKLATFVSAIVQIVRDVLWYVALIIGLVLCFSQIFYTMLIPNDCIEQATVKDCKPAEYYLITYSVLLGELDDELIRGIENRFFALALFFAFSFIMAIVMLNILIAVISDSYEKSMLRCNKLFGRARLHQLAEILALQDLFRVRETNKVSHRVFEWTTFQWTKGGFAFFIVIAFVYVFWIVIDLCAENSHVGYLSWFVYISNLIMFGIFVFLLANAAQESRIKIDNRFLKPVQERIQWLMIRVWGKSQNDALLNDQWSGRLIYIKREIEASTGKIRDSFDDLRKEMQNSQEETKELKRGLNEKIEKFEVLLTQMLHMNEAELNNREDRVAI